jgi:hypothetical protein
MMESWKAGMMENWNDGMMEEKMPGFFDFQRSSIPIFLFSCFLKGRQTVCRSAQMNG